MPPPMRRLHFLGFVGAAALAGCVGFGGPPSYTLSESDLQRLVERRFPIEKRYLDVLDVSVSAPAIRVMAERKRVGTGFDVAVRDRLLGASWRGRLALNSALRYEPQDRTLRLQDVEVEGFTPDGGGINPQAGRVGSLLAERLLEGMVIYTVSEDKLAQMQRLGYEPGAVEIGPRGLTIQSVPVRR